MWDLHVHSMFSPDCMQEPAGILKKAARLRLDGIVITEHDSFEASAPWDELETGDVLVLRAVEYRTAEGHLLIYGPDTDRHFQRERIPLAEMIHIATGEGWALVAPHPFKGASRDLGPAIYDTPGIHAVELNSRAMKNPEYRAPGNTPVGGPMGFAGPWGDGVLVPSVLWLRTYAPGNGTGPLGGVSIPKVILQLPTGGQFWLQPDASLAIERQTTTVAAGSDSPAEPDDFIGSQLGWRKVLGLSLIRAENRAYRQSQPFGTRPAATMKRLVRNMFLLLFNRGPIADPPGNCESAATTCN